MQRYGKRKVVAAAVTFAVLWAWLTWFAPDWKDNLQGFGTRPPDVAFRERKSGAWVQTAAKVESALPDSADAAGTVFHRARLRSVAGHPFTLLHTEDGKHAPAEGDSVRVRGVYEWDLKGGAVVVTKDGWVRRLR
jgi:hypothetical protein